MPHLPENVMDLIAVAYAADAQTLNKVARTCKDWNAVIQSLVRLTGRDSIIQRLLAVGTPAAYTFAAPVHVRHPLSRFGNVGIAPGNPNGRLLVAAAAADVHSGRVYILLLGQVEREVPRGLQTSNMGEILTFTRSGALAARTPYPRAVLFDFYYDQVDLVANQRWLVASVRKPTYNAGNHFVVFRVSEDPPTRKRKLHHDLEHHHNIGHHHNIEPEEETRPAILRLVHRIAFPKTNVSFDQHRPLEELLEPYVRVQQFTFSSEPNELDYLGLFLINQRPNALSTGVIEYGKWHVFDLSDPSERPRNRDQDQEVRIAAGASGAGAAYIVARPKFVDLSTECPFLRVRMPIHMLVADANRLLAGRKNESYLYAFSTALWRGNPIRLPIFCMSTIQTVFIPSRSRIFNGRVLKDTKMTMPLPPNKDILATFAGYPLFIPENQQAGVWWSFMRNTNTTSVARETCDSHGGRLLQNFIAKRSATHWANWMTHMFRPFYACDPAREVFYKYVVYTNMTDNIVRVYCERTATAKNHSIVVN